MFEPRPPTGEIHTMLLAAAPPAALIDTKTIYFYAIFNLALMGIRQKTQN